MNKAEEISRGNEAQSVLNNAIYQEAIVIMRAKLIEAFESTKFDEHLERDEIWRKMQTVDWLRRQMESVMKTGQLAADPQVATGAPH